MRGAALLFGETLGVAAPYALFDVLWLPFIASRERRQAYFLTVYGLHKEELPYGEPPVLTELLVFDDDAFWLSVLLLVLSPDGACLGGCSLCVPFPCA